MATKISDEIINKNQNKRKINNIDKKNINKGINSERFNFKKENEAKKNNYNNKDNKIQKDNVIFKNIEIPLYLKYMMKKGILKNLEIDKDNKNGPPIKKVKERKTRKRVMNFTFNFIGTSGNFSNTAVKILGDNNNQKIIKKEKNVNISNEKTLKIDLSLMKYNEYEINTLPYDEAIKIDKRTYIQFYFSLLKTKHLIIFSFCPSKDYNSRIIKIYLFFFSFAIYFSVNTLFFSDKTMHKIYEDGGNFNFIYQIPQIIYSFFISKILDSLLTSLSLSEKVIIGIRQETIIKNLEPKAKEVVKCLYYKFMLFFIISITFLLLFWYYVGCFCAVYKNTQIHLIKDTVISFSFSLLYPIGLYFIPGIFRIPALKAEKKDKVNMYKFSKFIQFL